VLTPCVTLSNYTGYLAGVTTAAVCSPGWQTDRAEENHGGSRGEIR